MNQFSFILLIFLLFGELGSSEEEKRRIPNCATICRMKYALRKLIERKPQLQPKFLRLGITLISITLSKRSHFSVR